VSTSTNALASLAKAAQEAADAAATTAGLTGLDTDLLSPNSEPYPSMRLTRLSRGFEGLGNWRAVQFSLWISQIDSDDFQIEEFCTEFLKEMGLKAGTQIAGESYLPLDDFTDAAYLAAYEDDSDSVPPLRGTFKVAIAGSQTWQNQWGGPDTWLNSLRLTIQSEGD
jgi:hypothetical protein